MFKFIPIFHFISISEKNYPIIELLCGTSDVSNEFFKASCPKHIRGALANSHEWVKKCDQLSGLQHSVHRLPLQDAESNCVYNSGTPATKYITILNKKVEKEWVYLALIALLLLIIILLLVLGVSDWHDDSYENQTMHNHGPLKSHPMMSKNKKNCFHALLS